MHYPHLPALTEEDKRKRPDVWHPLERRHPKSGRTALYIGRWACAIEGMPENEGAELVQYLQEFSVRPEFVYRHRWRLHDAVLWDNRCAQHCATPFDDAKYRRHMLRTTLEGDAPVMAATSRRQLSGGALNHTRSPALNFGAPPSFGASTSAALAVLQLEVVFERRAEIEDVPHRAAPRKAVSSAVSRTSCARSGRIASASCLHAVKKFMRPMNSATKRVAGRS